MRVAQNSGGPSTPWPAPSLGAPPLFSPTLSLSAFPTAASASPVSEHPCVNLFEWWLARVEGHDQKIAVGGRFLRNWEILDFPAVPIAKRHEPFVLESEDGTVVTIHDSFNINRTLENGFTIEACEKFSVGFPEWWDKWMLYPEMTRSQTGSQSTSISTSNSTKFYLEMLQTGRLLGSLGTRIWNALNKVEAFPDPSCLPNGAPRFEEYISDDDTPTIKNSAASNYDGSEIIDMETVLAGASTFNEEKSHEGIYSNVPSVSTVECTNGEGNAGVGNASSINNGLQKTPVSSLNLKKSQHVALSESVPGEGTPTLPLEKGEQPVGRSRKQRSAFGKLQRATRSSSIICPSPNGEQPIRRSRKQRSACGKLQRVTRSSSIICSSSNGDLSQLIHFWPKSLSLATPESLKLKKTRSGRVVVPLLDRGLCQNIIYAPDGSISAIIGLDSTPPLKGSMLKNHARKKKRTN